VDIVDQDWEEAVGDDCRDEGDDHARLSFELRRSLERDLQIGDVLGQFLFDLHDTCYLAAPYALPASTSTDRVWYWY